MPKSELSRLLHVNYTTVISWEKAGIDIKNFMSFAESVEMDLAKLFRGQYTHKRRIMMDAKMTRYDFNNWWKIQNAQVEFSICGMNFYYMEE